MRPLRPPTLSRRHLRRLRQYHRSAGWPCLDNLEVELLAAGVIARCADSSGREWIRVTDAGIAALRSYIEQNRRQRDPHETLVGRVVGFLAAESRLVFRGLRLRADCGGGRWSPVRPDVFSIRQTNVEAYVDPVIHEIKVNRADLRADLRNPAKRTGYQALAREFYYVIADGIADPGEIPDDCGVIVAADSRLVCARPSPRRPVTLRIEHWIALARARCEAVDAEPDQLELGDVASPATAAFGA